MRIIIFILGLLIIFPTISAGRVVDFIVNTPATTPPNSLIYLTGEIPGECAWQPNCLKMNPIGFGSYSVTVNLPDSFKKVSYKITRGTWETESADSYSRPYSNFTVPLDVKGKPIIHNILHWKDLAPLTTSINVQPIFSLNNREISVYLPASYYTTSNTYPVIYVHDGQNVFDPKTSSYNMEWSIDESMDRLIRENKIPEAIIVAIHTNDIDRESDYDYFLRGKSYSDFIVNNLIPKIEIDYRVKKNKEHRYLMGSSMGALISLMMLVDRPDVFSKAAGLSFPARIHDRAIFRFLEKKKNYLI